MNNITVKTNPLTYFTQFLEQGNTLLFYELCKVHEWAGFHANTIHVPRRLGNMSALFRSTAEIWPALLQPDHLTIAGTIYELIYFLVPN